MTRGRAGRGPRFATRLLLAQSLVLVAGALTIWLVASAVGPSIFHDHLEQAGVGHSEEETQHVEEAFASALLISVSVALVAAVRRRPRRVVVLQPPHPTLHRPRRRGLLPDRRRPL